MRVICAVVTHPQRKLWLCDKQRCDTLWLGDRTPRIFPETIGRKHELNTASRKGPKTISSLVPGWLGLSQKPSPVWKAYTDILWSSAGQRRRRLHRRLATYLRLNSALITSYTTCRRRRRSRWGREKEREREGWSPKQIWIRFSIWFLINHSARPLGQLAQTSFAAFFTFPPLAERATRVILVQILTPVRVRTWGNPFAVLCRRLRLRFPVRVRSQRFRRRRLSSRVCSWFGLVNSNNGCGCLDAPFLSIATA